MVHADAHRRVVLAADVEERHELLFYLFQFGGVFFVGVFEFFERARRVHVVAGVYPHLFGVEGCHVRHVGVEMHVRHERRVVSVGAQLRVDFLQVLRLAHSLCGEAHVFASRGDNPLRLCHARCGVGGGGGGHRLHPHWVVASERRSPHVHLMGGAAGVVEQVYFVGHVICVALWVGWGRRQ